MNSLSHRDALNRRRFLQGALAAGAAGAIAPSFMRPAFAAASARPKVGVVLTEFSYRSHAHVILENCVQPYLFNGQPTDPGVEIVSMYVDQFPDGEMSRDVSKQYNIPIFETIGEAITLGSDKLAVDAVLSIGEHGSYPHNEKGQHMYPRKRFFDEIVAVFRNSDRAVPVFSDKHLSYRFDWAREMYDTSRELGFPLMAGSSVPLAERKPPLEMPADAQYEAAVSIHGGGVESYDFHALEVLQSMIESRRGGESGVKQVQFLTGDALWKAADAGLWSRDLADRAMAAELGPDLPPVKELCDSQKLGSGAPHGVLVTYRDGLRAIALKVGDSSTRWNFAAKLKGKAKPVATAFYVGPWQNRNLFKALSHAIQTFFREGQTPYPVERTLLVTGILDAEMDSRYQGGVPIDTPQLDIAYQPRDYRAMREMGASWKLITEDMPEPRGMAPPAKA
ncbi:MAG: twin-arginine translocation signal domain-containing protein [Pirellulales bacterium]|nr:twin-arginine translocation signal domain-containing protein [Pirellulales bacterium]